MCVCVCVCVYTCTDTHKYIFNIFLLVIIVKVSALLDLIFLYFSDIKMFEIQKQLNAFFKKEMGPTLAFNAN